MILPMDHCLGDCANKGNSGRLGLTLPDVKAASAKLASKFLSLLVLRQIPISPVPEEIATFVPGYVELYNQIGLIRG